MTVQWVYAQFSQLLQQMPPAPSLADVVSGVSNIVTRILMIQLEPLVEHGKRTYAVLKEEAPALTLLFFSALGLFPFWISFLIGSCSALKLASAIATARHAYVGAAEWKAQKDAVEGRATRAEEDLKGVIRERDTLQGKYSDLQVVNQQQSQRVQQLTAQVDHLTRVDVVIKEVVELQQKMADPEQRMNQGLEGQVRGLQQQVQALKVEASRLAQEYIAGANAPGLRPPQSVELSEEWKRKIQGFLNHLQDLQRPSFGDTLTGLGQALKMHRRTMQPLIVDENVVIAFQVEEQILEGIFSLLTPSQISV